MLRVWISQGTYRNAGADTCTSSLCLPAIRIGMKHVTHMDLCRCLRVNRVLALSHVTCFIRIGAMTRSDVGHASFLCALQGGTVIFCGCPRVNGVLATSRGFGDKELKRWVSAEPEIQHRLLEPGLYICTYIYMYTHMYIYTYTYIYIYK